MTPLDPQLLSCDVPGMSHHHLPGNTSSCETRLAKDYQELLKIKASMEMLDKTKRALRQLEE